MDHLLYACSTGIAVAASGVYLLDRNDFIYNPFLTLFAMIYFAVDILKCRPVYKIHHVCVGLLMCSLWLQHNPILSMFLYKMELSTLFFNALPYVENKAPLMGAFLLSFLKIRVLDFYWFLQDPVVEAFFVKGAMLRACFYLVYAVNLYWFSLIIKKCVGRRAQGPYYATLCQKIAAYSYLGAIPAAMACPHLLCLHTFTAVTSFFYHNAVAADAPRVKLFILDSVMIHVITYSNMAAVTTSTCLHCVSIVVNAGSLAARLSLIPSYDTAIAMSYIPIVCDCLVIALSQAPNSFKLDYALQLYLIFLCFHVKFLNELSFICFHVIMWFNTRTMATI